jgi:hypothetical protein
MFCQKTAGLGKLVRGYRNFHFKTGLLLDTGVRLVGLNRCPLTSPFYKLAKLAGYTNVALASLALVVLED